MKGRMVLIGVLVVLFNVVFLVPYTTLPSSQAADPIIVGVPTSLYTPFGSYGLKAVNLAVEEINAAGGVAVGNEKRPLKVVVADTRGGEPGTPVHDALMAYEKLITGTKAPRHCNRRLSAPRYSLPPWTLCPSTRCRTSAPLRRLLRFKAQFRKDPEKYKYLFRVTTDALIDAGYIARTLDMIKKDYNLERVFHIYQDTLWAKAFAGLLQKHCAETGWTEIGFEPYAAGASDFSPALTKARETKTQVISMVWDVPLGAGVFAKQYVAMKVPALLIGFIPPMGSPIAAQAVGPEVEYSITVEFPVGASLALAKMPKTVDVSEITSRKNTVNFLSRRL
jgi:branched-chain amino acid transport system substrate-binding protein